MEENQPESTPHPKESARRTKKVTLSRKAIELLVLASEGKGNKEIARELGVTTHTVQWHWKRIRAILGTTDRTQSVCKGLNLAYHDQLERANEELKKAKALEEKLRKAQRQLTTILAEVQKKGVEAQQKSRFVNLMLHATQSARAVAYELESVNPVIHRLLSPSAALFGIDVHKTIRGDKTFYDLIHPDDLPELYSLTAASEPAFEPGVRYLYLYRLQMPEVRWILDVHEARFDSGGAFCGAIGLAIDVHDLVELGVIEGKVGRYRS